jgi:methionyl-tRNA synthetase
MSGRFIDLALALNLSHDDFIRTSEARHKQAVAHFWQKLQAHGHIYKATYSGWYALRDEAFYAEAELIDGKAPTGAEVVWLEEPSYFFNLSTWQDKLLKFYEDNPDFIFPASRTKEVVNFVKSGLKDLSISRSSFSWGIKVPNDPEHVVYVWLDALVNYLSALGYPDEKYQSFWPADIHMVGKDILRFHAIYWPAFLMAAELPLPQKIVAHGWWTIDGEKISKSLKNVIDPLDLIAEFGLDQTRYFLMREITFGQDGNYAKAAMINRINSELANNIGNLTMRTLSMINKNCQGIIPTLDDDQVGVELIALAKSTLDKVSAHLHQQEFSLALEAIVNLASQGNVFIDQQAPWKLAKTNVALMGDVLYILAQVIKYLGVLLQAFMPDAASKMLDLLKIDAQDRQLSCLSKPLRSGILLPAPEVIFPRYLP